MKVLVYAFEPFGKYKQNISKEVLLKLRSRSYLTKIVFPVRFDEKMFANEVKISSPSIIIGLGQYPRGRKIRIERRAANIKGYKNHSSEIIIPNGSRFLAINLKLTPDVNSWVSYDAGKYVCNFSMYTIINAIKNNDIQFAFIHIPKNYSVTRAVRFVEAKLDGLVLSP
jgi:pyrrolidone-carboxylate peptidase